LTAHFALFPWFAWSELLAGIAKTSMQRVQNSSQDKDWAVSKFSDTNLVFKTDIFLIAVVINTLAAGLNQAVRKKQLIRTWLCG